MTILLASFPGSGKTETVKNLVSKGFKVKELATNEYNNYGTYPNNLIEAIQQELSSKEQSIVVIGTEIPVLEKLLELKIPYILAHPNVKMKDHFVKVFKKAKKPSDYIADKIRNWEDTCLQLGAIAKGNFELVVGVEYTEPDDTLLDVINMLQLL